MHLDSFPGIDPRADDTLDARLAQIELLASIVLRTRVRRRNDATEIASFIGVGHAGKRVANPVPNGHH
jgi:hypothetical protein